MKKKISTTREELIEAEKIWISAYREDPSAFADTSEMSVDEWATRNVDALLDYTEQVRNKQ